MSRRLLALPVALVLLSACGGSAADERRAQVAAVIEAANARDADAVRERADALRATVLAQRGSDEIAVAEAERFVALAEAVRTSADVIDEELLEQQRLEAERRRLEQERQRLEQERRQAEEEAARQAEEEAARQAEEEEREDDGKGKGKGEGKDDD